MYNCCSDERLTELAASGDGSALETLITRYKSLVLSRARKYFLTGGDIEDLVQEGMIGLYKAVKDYDPDKNTGFSTFAYNCVTKMIMTAIKRDSTLKNRPLNTSLNIADYALEKVKNEISPEDIVIEKEDFEEMKGKLNKLLSGLELSVLDLYMEGLSYAEISAGLDKSIKAIDNALARAKQKIKNSFTKENC